MKFDKNKKYVLNKEKFKDFARKSIGEQKWIDKHDFEYVEVRDKNYGYVKTKRGVELIVFPEMCDEVI